MELKKRTLKFYCGSCDDSDPQTPIMAEQILISIDPILDDKLKNVSERTKSLITSLSKQIVDLTASNNDCLSFSIQFLLETSFMAMRGNVIRGTIPIPVTDNGWGTFAAVVRHAHIYVGNVNPDVSRESVADYVRENSPNANFDLEELPKREEALSRALELSVDFSLLGTFNHPNFWPQNVMNKTFFSSQEKNSDVGGQRGCSGSNPRIDSL